MSNVAVIGADRAVSVQSTADVPLTADEVRVDVAYCGVCGSDLHLFFDTPEPMTGHVLGHEFSGTISELGSGVEGWSVGDNVVVLPIDECGECLACRRADGTGVCVAGLTQGPGLGRAGALAESVVVPARMLFAVPDSLDLRTAALTEPLAVTLRGVWHSGAQAGDSVVVMGAGPIGLLATQALHARGITDVLVVEPNPDRRQLAERFGVAATAPDDLFARAAQLAGPVRAVLDCTGNAAVLAHSLSVLGYAGTVVILGITVEASEIYTMLLAVNELPIVGPPAYSRRDFAEALDALASGRVNSDALITSVIGLDQVDAKLHELASGTSPDVKVLVQPGLLES
ncbi:alcohol dehydrogenase catalytic domain-containing protein [uncultured Gordonia sp.]|uniref:alcohol dehydrogenase catalytic domain-containing protein n=1 Tax=uncultured Gordonia sp. TaxID=198437 RepID=UPI002622C97E|nr:alcohol dehydrogenase catalytic domain-containing protein [uncultured Gordonia sp.]